MHFKYSRLHLVFSLLVLLFFAAGSAHAAKKTLDHGKKPWVVNIDKLTVNNTNYRTTKWTGKNLQMTVMSIKVGGEVGLEKHDTVDQFIRVEKGTARVVMGRSRKKMTFNKKVSADWAIFIPQGFWHNIINTGNEPLKIYVLYAPPQHPKGTVHKTFSEALRGD
jgi:mannose-6-phosphate isomerase-like protein (cupin superfamily)